MPEQQISFCAVRGLPQPRRMCMKVIAGEDAQGRKRCGHDGPCEHKRRGLPDGQGAEPKTGEEGAWA